MKLRLTILAVLLAALFLASAPDRAHAQSNGSCGIVPIKPIQPPRCRDLEAICMCDDRGYNCKWKWVCVK